MNNFQILGYPQPPRDMFFFILGLIPLDNVGSRAPAFIPHKISNLMKGTIPLPSQCCVKGYFCRIHCIIIRLVPQSDHCVQYICELLETSSGSLTFFVNIFRAACLFLTPRQTTRISGVRLGFINM